MKNQRPLPPALLSQSNLTRLNYFREYTLAHPVLVQTSRELTEAICGPLPGSLILVFGPTGSGKTTLRLRTENRITADMMQEVEADPGRIPIIGLYAASPTKGIFSWPDFFRRLLYAMNEPCIDQKKVYQPFDPLDGLKFSARSSETAMRFAAEQALKFRRPKALVIDEGQHLGKVSSGRQLHDQLDAIKSFSTMAGIPIVLVGTYELLHFRNLSGQLSRRSIDIHFPRYDANKDTDVRAFKNVVWNFQRHLPLENEPNLVESWEFLYERSLGCVGILKDWLTITLTDALNAGARSLDPALIEKRALKISQCKTILDEITEGENTFKETPNDLILLRQAMGLPVCKNTSRKRTENGGHSNDNKKRGASVPKRRVGERNPIRDPVGYANQRP